MLPYKTIVAAFAVAACAAPQATQPVADQQSALQPVTHKSSETAALPGSGQVDELSNAAKSTRVLWFYGDHGP